MVRRWWKQRKANKQQATQRKRRRPPLREFVYLDDVSVRSLLASQTGALTNEVTDLLSKADEAELASSIGATTPVLGSEVRSRIQTTTSQGTQTSRKATVQSLFKELWELEGIHVAFAGQADLPQAQTLDHLIGSGTAVAATSLTRGALIEIEVELGAAPIFRFSTIASVFTEMADDFPEMLEQHGVRDGMATIVPGNRLLRRFLAGLVPLAARSTSHVVIDVDGIEYVVSVAAARALGLQSRPLTIVGVTEHNWYWRDVRRVLFSGLRFTMLCRIARTGLSDDWEPVKLAEVLKEVLPTFPNQLADVGNVGLSAGRSTNSSAPSPVLPALSEFIDLVQQAEVPGLTEAAVAAARKVAAGPAAEQAATVTGQNEAFRLVIAELEAHGCEPTGDEWLELTRSARRHAHLTLFGQASTSATDGPDPGDDRLDNDRLLDTEVIAIYW